jgi:hypothetical protein
MTCDPHKGVLQYQLQLPLTTPRRPPRVLPSTAIRESFNNTPRVLRDCLKSKTLFSVQEQAVAWPSPS